ncbi:transposase [bacterium]|nr:transposase [bacterium]
MRCRKEQFIKNSIFHIYNRTISGERLFRDDDDYLKFLRKLKDTVPRYPCSLYAYCLMPTHFHFLIRQDGDESIYKIFNHVLSYYVQTFNFKHKRRGRLMQGPLQHIQVVKENHLFLLSQYIHLNPVKANLVNTPHDWVYSNFREWVGTRKGTLYVDALLKRYFNNSLDDYWEAVEKYQQNPDDLEGITFDES